jgi:hypothetical protein
MAQPDFVPVAPSDRVRPSSQLPAAGHWAQQRPAEILTLRQPVGTRLGSTGSDLGYGLKLAERVAERAELQEGEHLADAVAGCFACGARRASLLHRSPVIYDMELAFRLWGFFPGGPKELVAYRAPLFAGASHSYSRQRAIVDAVPEETLRLSAAQVSSQLAQWERLLGR